MKTQYHLTIDGPLFREQRQLILAIMFQEGLTSDERELLEGVTNLLDAIADQAHEHYGIDCLLTNMRTQ
jgi:hypothetical protein